MTTSKETIYSTQYAKELATLVGFGGLYVNNLIKTVQERFNTNETNVNKLLTIVKKYQYGLVVLEAKKFGLSGKAYHSLEKKGIELLSSFAMGYSMGEERVLSLLYNGKYRRFVRLDKTSEYSRKCTWKAKHGYLEINLTLAQFKGLYLEDGVWKLEGGKSRLVASGNKSTYKVEIVAC